MKKLHYIKDEMLVHIPVCTHTDPRSVLLVGGCDNLYAEVKKHKTIEKIERLSADEASEKLTDIPENSFDIVIVAVDNFKSDRIFWGLLGRALNDKGLLTTMSSLLLVEEESCREELTAAGEIFKIVMPYRYESLADDGHLLCKNLLLASKHYHPTADINLQRADLTEGFHYYNSDIAIGAFQLPTVVRKKYLGLIKL